MTKELIDRINVLAKKKKEGTITEVELQEQAVLREEYLAMFRERFKYQLEGIEIVDDPKSIQN